MLRKLLTRFKPPKKALVFIDYEYWFYSYSQNFDLKPDLKVVLDLMRQRYRVKQIFLFGDFTRSELSDSIAGITPDDVTVINTGEMFFYRKKNMTDFIILDHLYRSAIRKNISTFVLLSGDGHFRFAAQYLRELGKNVDLYAVVGCTSKALREVATKFEELPLEGDRYRCYFRMIGEHLAYVNERTSSWPTFLKTAEVVANTYGVPNDRVVDALRKMLDMGYLSQVVQKSAHGRDMRVLKIHWERMIKDGIWDPNKTLRFEKY